MKRIISKEIKSAKKRAEIAFEILESLRGGAIAIAPVEQGYVLVADMYSEQGVERIKSLKELSEEIYFPLLVSNVDQLTPLSGPVTPEKRLLALEYWPGPLIIQCPSIAGSMLKMGSKYIPETLYFRCSSDAILSEVCELIGPLVYTPILKENKIVSDVKEISKEFKDAASHFISGSRFKPNQIPTIIGFDSRGASLVKVGAIEESKIRRIIPNLRSN